MTRITENIIGEFAMELLERLGYHYNTSFKVDNYER